MARMFPIGMQTFSDICENKAIYIDKTALIYNLVHEGKVYFLSRPRRFGKSLLISTLEAYFCGQKELFKDLAIENLEKDWIKYPVFRFDFSAKKSVTPEGLGNLMDNMLSFLEDRYQPKAAPKNDYALRLKNLIYAAEEKTGQKCVILIDEYDAPLLDTIADESTFKTLRNMMRDFYSPIKAADAHLKFVFLTGITKFSQLSIFSELNNLENISMEPKYAALCGITKEELFQLVPELAAFAEKKGFSSEEAVLALKNMYDGYHFSKASPDIFNPFSLLNALKQMDLGYYWFSTGTPTFLIEAVSHFHIKPSEYDSGLWLPEESFYVATETATTPLPMLYQSGYLTIKEYDEETSSYLLAFPNNEVRRGFLRGLLPYYATKDDYENQTFMRSFAVALREGEVDKAMGLLRSFLASIPYNAERQDEDHYKTICYLLCRLITPFGVKTEECSAAGRADVVVEAKGTIYCFEFKLGRPAREALAQIGQKGYLVPYEAGHQKLVKIGVSIGKESRTVDEWLVE